RQPLAECSVARPTVMRVADDCPGPETLLDPIVDLFAALFAGHVMAGAAPADGVMVEDDAETHVLAGRNHRDATWTIALAGPEVKVFLVFLGCEVMPGHPVRLLVRDPDRRQPIGLAGGVACQMDGAEIPLDE